LKNVHGPRENFYRSLRLLLRDRKGKKEEKKEFSGFLRLVSSSEAGLTNLKPRIKKATN